VNLVLKKPLPVPRFEFSASGGELGFGRVTGDATGPLNDTRTMRYRVVGAAEWLGNNIENDEQRTTVTPTVAFDLGERSTLTADVEYYQQRGRNYRHAVPSTPDTQRGDFSKIPWDLSIAGPDDGWTGSNVAPGIRLDTALGKRASLHVAGRYTRINGDLDIQGLLNLTSDGHTANRYLYREISVWDEYQSDSFATMAAHTGRLDHQFVVGLEAGLSKTNSQIGVGAAPPLDIYAPVYGPKPAEPASSPTRFDVSRVGGYVTDRIRLARALIVDAGLRWSRINITDHVGEKSSPSTKLTPTIGVVVLPRSSLAFYANYASGFEAPPPGAFLEGASPLSPVTSESIEAGVKSELRDGRVLASAAAFHIRRTNVPEATALGFFRQIAEGGSHGVELELAGRLTSQTGLHGGYAWCPTEIIEDASGFSGNVLPNAPRHKANVWFNYGFDEGPLDRLTLAVGVVHVSDRFTASNNGIVAPSYTRTDATGFYTFGTRKLTLGVIAQNLFDGHYVTSGAGQVLFAAPPRRLAIQLTAAL